MKNKRLGWHSLTTVLTFANGEEYVRKGLDDAYLRLYLQYNVGIRPSCYHCSFKGGNSVADITLGDFWGLDGTKLDDNIGTSAVLCRTQKGVALFEAIKSNVIHQRMSLNDVMKGNPCLYESVEEAKCDMDEFYRIYTEQGYGGAMDMLMKDNWE